MGHPPAIEIRPLKTHAEFRQCERIQQNTWGTLGVSSEVLIVTQKNDGMVLGALAGPQVVGFIYAFLGRRNGRLIHWSHQMAVEREYRDQKLGFRLKLEHRRHALNRGIGAIAWTYDPLQSRNANLNIARLGAQAREYLPDCYGHFPSIIERGLPTDRLVAWWDIGSRRVANRLDGNPVPFSTSWPAANHTSSNKAGLLVNRKLDFSLHGKRILIEIPVHTDRMREADLRLARRWRLEVRRLVQHYFGAGYYAYDFIAPSHSTNDRAFYVLARPGRS